MVNVNRDTCIGCEMCVQVKGDVFEMVDGKAQVKAGQEGNGDVQEAIEACPSDSISN